MTLRLRPARPLAFLVRQVELHTGVDCSQKRLVLGGRVLPLADAARQHVAAGAKLTCIGPAAPVPATGADPGPLLWRMLETFVQGLGTDAQARDAVRLVQGDHAAQMRLLSPRMAAAALCEQRDAAAASS